MAFFYKGKLNLAIVNKVIDKAIGKGKGGKVMDNLVYKKYKKEKRSLIHKFVSDERTQDIDRKDRLFGFIGFYAEEDPIGPVVMLLEDTITAKYVGYNPSARRRKYDITYPDGRVIRGVSDMHWGTRRSWILALEQGTLLNAQQFIPREEYGRSEGGYQDIKRPSSRPPLYVAPPPRKYLQGWIQDFVEAMKR